MLQRSELIHKRISDRLVAVSCSDHSYSAAAIEVSPALCVVHVLALAADKQGGGGEVV